MKIYNENLVMIHWNDFYNILMKIPLNDLIKLFSPDLVTEKLWKKIKPLPPLTKKQAIISKIYVEYEVKMRPTLTEEWKRL